MRLRMVELSVVIPAYEEAARLGPTLDRVRAYLDGRGLTHEILVVDDGSADDTAALARRHGAAVLRHPRNAGKGAALRSGVLASQGRRVLLTDADLSTPIEDLELLEPELAAAPVVLGSRGVAASRVTSRQPLYRELMGKSFNRVIRLLGLTAMRDTQCGFKLLDGEVARELFAALTTSRFAYDVELVWLARRRGYAVREVGVAWANSPDSRVHAVRDSARMLWDVLRLRLRPRGGR
jgi:dolichyl-phosphate beta-glucosyltransferase